MVMILLGFSHYRFLEVCLPVEPAILGMVVPSRGYTLTPPVIPQETR